ncbi:hypothetical protein BDV12DRAFT_201840 [Aspergillus spectabilis]
MRIGSGLFAALTGLSALSFSNAAYWIDPESCSKQAHQDLIVEGIEGALKMMDAAATQLTNPNDDFTRVLTTLFGPDTQRQTNNLRRIYAKTIPSVRTRDMSATKPLLGYYGVRFYCDSRRLTRKYSLTKGTWLFNEHTRERIDNEPTVGEQLGSFFECALVFAWTTCPWSDAESCEITFCPFFLEYAMKRKHNTFISWWRPNLWARLALLVDRRITDRWFTPIDLVSLFDKVILHEIMHTRGAEGGPLPRDRYNPEDVGGVRGYGWNNVKKIANVVTDLSVRPLVLGPEKNADSLALFGSAALMIQEGIKINDNGSFVRPEGMNERRFDVWFEELLEKNEESK